MMSRVLLLVLLVSCVSSPGLAQAGETKANKEEARAHFKQGVQLVREGAYEAALVELKRAYELSPDYRVLFNIGQTALQLNEYLAAIDAYRAYLAEGGSRIEPDRRAAVEAELLELEKRVATLTIVVDVDGAKVAIDGRTVGTSPLDGKVTVNVGRHQVSASTGIGATVSQEVEVAGGDARTVRLELPSPERSDVSASVDAIDTRTSAANASSLRKRRIGIAFLSAGGALAAGAVVTGMLAKSAHDDHQRELEKPLGDANAIASAKNDMKTYAVTTDVLAFTGGALLVTGLVMMLVSKNHERPSEPKVSVSASRHSLTLSTRF
jgi:tetratricopeptide (TPR) repeat protein